ncbi:MAG: YgjV family protein [Flavobacteriaceae bacterium]
MELLEVVGWIATLIVISSFIINDMLRLRTVNLIGAICWLIYGILAVSSSIIFLNIVIVGIQSFKIWKLIQNTKS